jgi:hypothetical protein
MDWLKKKIGNSSNTLDKNPNSIIAPTAHVEKKPLGTMTTSVHSVAQQIKNVSGLGEIQQLEITGVKKLDNWDNEQKIHGNMQCRVTITCDEMKKIIKKVKTYNILKDKKSAIEGKSSQIDHGKVSVIGISSHLDAIDKMKEKNDEVLLANIYNLSKEVGKLQKLLNDKIAEETGKLNKELSKNILLSKDIDNIQVSIITNKDIPAQTYDPKTGHKVKLSAVPAPTANNGYVSEIDVNGKHIVVRLNDKSGTHTLSLNDLCIVDENCNWKSSPSNQNVQQTASVMAPITLPVTTPTTTTVNSSVAVPVAAPTNVSVDVPPTTTQFIAPVNEGIGSVEQKGGNKHKSKNLKAYSLGAKLFADSDVSEFN